MDVAVAVGVVVGVAMGFLLGLGGSGRIFEKRLLPLGVSGKGLSNEAIF